MAQTKLGGSPPVEAADSTRLKLLVTAERLFGQLGLEGVSLRAVSLAAGQGNYSAVQYHFKDKRGLIDAVWRMRLDWLDRRRLERLLQAYAEGRTNDVRLLVDVLFRPIAEIVDENGQRTYARFLLQCVSHVEQWAVMGYPLAEPLDLANPTVRVFLLLAQQLPDLPRPILRHRVDRFLRAFLAAVVQQENSVLNGDDSWPDEVAMADLLDTIAAGLAAPASPQTIAAARVMGPGVE